jgi:23S rRNA pseudouridine2604 synthase
MPEPKRINKYISETGFCSRREADRLVEEGRVLVNGQKPEVGTKIIPNDKVFVDGKLVGAKSERIYLAFNKPIMVTCTTDSKDKDNIIDYINYEERIFPIGRLDKMSEGLIFLTNDGDIVNKILRAGNMHEKEYEVQVDHELTDKFFDKMANGVNILGTRTKKCKVSRIDKFTFRIILTQGLNRQIRRMCEELGYGIRWLKRVRIMNIRLGNLAKGKWRYLTKQEVNDIMRMVEASTGTEEGSR